MASADRRRLLSPEALVAVLAVAYLALMVWWLSTDTRVPYGESGKHLFISMVYLDAIKDGHLGAPFYYWEQYPPLLHLVGVVLMSITGYSAKFATAALNAIFIPLLLVGCYGAGRTAYGRQAGVLAAVFALAVPMMVLLSHMFMLEIPLAALTGLSVWLLLASERFSRPGYSAAAGLTIGLGMMTKATFFLPFIGVVAVILVRGGWRSWKNGLVAAGAAVVVSLPWYVYHHDNVSPLVGGAADAGSPGGLGFSPPRGSLDDLTWYGWNLLNNQLFLPLTLLLVVGIVILGVRWLRNRDRDDFTPELLAGAVVGYLAHTMISLNDQRYTFPLLVFAAVLATGWIPRVPRLAKGFAYAVLAVALVVNTYAFTFGSDVKLEIALSTDPNRSSPVQSGQVMVLNSKGFILNEAQALSTKPEPSRESDVDAVLRTAASQGTERVTIHGATWPDFADVSLIVLARAHGIRAFVDRERKQLGPSDLNLVRLPVAPGMPPPCQVLDDGAGLYVVKGPVRIIDESTVARQRGRLVCPGRPQTG